MKIGPWLHKFTRGARLINYFLILNCQNLPRYRLIVTVFAMALEQERVQAGFLEQIQAPLVGDARSAMC